VARNISQILKNPSSAVGDAYRVLRTNLIFTSAETTGRVLVVTSATTGRGEDDDARHLASALAHNGAKVLAVDAGPPRPTLHSALRPPEDAAGSRISSWARPRRRRPSRRRA